MVIPVLLQTVPNVDLLLAAISLIILLGYIAETIFMKTRVPEVLILMFLGILLVPIGHLLPSAYANTLRNLTPLFSSLALIMIMFNSGRVMRFKGRDFSSSMGLVLALMDVLIAAAVISVIMHYVFGWPFVYGALLGAIVGESSAVIVMPLIKKVRVPQEIYNMLLMETTFNTVFAILIFYLLLILTSGASFSLYSYMQYIIDYLSVPLFIGLIVGFGWIILQSLIKGANNYIASLAIAILLYSFVDFLKGSAVVAVLIYAIILGNEKWIDKLLKLKNEGDMKEFKIVERELEFLVKTFFFVLIGVISILTLSYLLTALMIVVVIITLRYLQVSAAMPRDLYTYKNVIFSLMQKGFGVAVLSSLVYSYNIPYASEIFAISFMLIVLSNIISAPLVRWSTKGMTLSSA